MGPLHKRVVKYKGLRAEPLLETRVEEYRKYLVREGLIISGERVIVGVRGRGIALITSLPEVIGKKCQRMGVPFKIGDVTVVIDILKRVEREEETMNQTPEGFTDYQRVQRGTKTILLSKIILPALVEGGNRQDMIRSVLLDPHERINGWDVYRLKSEDVERVYERENDIFAVAD